MFGVVALVSFILSFLFNVWAISHGHFAYQSLAILGFIFLTCHLIWGSWAPWKHNA